MIQIIIPARYSSVRLPGKPLLKLNGVELIRHVYDIAYKAYKNWNENVPMLRPIIATDSPEISRFCESQNLSYCVTGSANTGTDRVFKALQNLPEKPSVIVNLQGDEPLVPSDYLSEFCKSSLSTCCDNKILNAFCPLPDNRAQDINNVKGIITSNGLVCFLTRLAQPAFISGYKPAFYKQMGLYSFTADSLEQFCNLPPSNLEALTNIELLRWLDHGFKIASHICPASTYSVDIVEDLLLVERMIDFRGIS
ncbi:hypothetical protein N8537_00330 [Synechococcus sp. AH-601-J22]|nr:hypothetical protein [Synechococcus sp. AH-601-J22]